MAKTDKTSKKLTGNSRGAALVPCSVTGAESSDSPAGALPALDPAPVQVPKVTP